MTNDATILHIADPADWDRRTSTHYQPAALADEGFVHCCTPDQLVGVTERYYAGRNGLVLLELDPRALDAALVWEDTTGRGEDFPHIYGPIVLEAVISTAPYPDC